MLRSQKVNNEFDGTYKNVNIFYNLKNIQFTHQYSNKYKINEFLFI